MKTFNTAATLLATALAACLATSAQAVIINPTFVSGDNLFTVVELGFDPVNLTTDYLLSTPVSTGASLAQAQSAVFTGSRQYNSYWETFSTGDVNSGYFSIYAAPTFVFDLGSINTLSNVVLWNGFATLGNQAKGFSLSFSNDGTNFAGSYSNILAASNVESVENAQTFALNDISAQYVALTLTSNYANDSVMPGGDRVDLGKVRFDVADQVAAVPEPETWALMLAGFGAVGLAVRRRTKVAPSCA